MLLVIWRSTVCTVITIYCAVLLVPVSIAQVMSGGSYQIQSDSINMGGGFSSSTNFTSESTAGEIATGGSDSENFTIQAGFQQMQESFISISPVDAVVLQPSLGGVVGGVANGSSTVTVITDNSAGYSLRIVSATSPALQSETDAIDDYQPVAAADYSFLYGVGDAVFGLSPTGADVITQFLDNGSVCGVAGTSNAERCWVGSSTTQQELARTAGSNHPDGATTTIHFRVAIGSGVNQPPGTYVGTTTVTALPL